MRPPSHRGTHQLSLDDHSGRHEGSFLRSPAGLALLGFLIVAGALLFTEHRTHVLGVLLYVPLLLCPLMHFFMHGHGGHGSHGQEEGEGGAS
jgi:hypothetical protein